MDDVLEGYRAVGRFRPERWQNARSDNHDVGCLLLADHGPESSWELMYMGLAPEARGRGFGLEITRHAQWLASRDNVERLLLAVDASNYPALAMYAQAGFEIWDRRSVFARAFVDKTEANVQLPDKCAG
jgi:ribosomal protein S18 acetylase RimI-like enzyme